MQYLMHFLFIWVIGLSLAVLNNGQQDVGSKPTLYNSPASQYLPSEIDRYSNIQRPNEDTTLNPRIYKYPKPKILNLASQKPTDVGFQNQGAFHHNGISQQNELPNKKDYSSGPYTYTEALNQQNIPGYSQYNGSPSKYKDSLSNEGTTHQHNVQGSKEQANKDSHQLQRPSVEENHFSQSSSGIYHQTQTTKPPQANYHPYDYNESSSQSFPETLTQNSQVSSQYRPPVKNNDAWIPITNNQAINQQNHSSGVYPYNESYQQNIPQLQNDKGQFNNQQHISVGQIPKDVPNQYLNLPGNSFQSHGYNFYKEPLLTSTTHQYRDNQTQTFSSSPTQISNLQNPIQSNQNPIQYTTPSKKYLPPFLGTISSTNFSNTNSPNYENQSPQFLGNQNTPNQLPFRPKFDQSTPTPPVSITSTSSYNGIDYQYLPATTTRPNRVSDFSSNNSSQNFYHYNLSWNQQNTSSINKPGAIALHEGYRYKTPALKDPSPYVQTINGINYNELGMGMNEIAAKKPDPEEPKAPETSGNTEIETTEGYAYGKPEGNSIRDGITHLIPVPTMPSSYIYYRPQQQDETTQRPFEHKTNYNSQTQSPETTTEISRPFNQRIEISSNRPQNSPSSIGNSLIGQQVPPQSNLPESWGSIPSNFLSSSNYGTNLWRNQTVESNPNLVNPSYHVGSSSPEIDNIGLNGPSNYSFVSDSKEISHPILPNYGQKQFTPRQEDKNVQPSKQNPSSSHSKDPSQFENFNQYSSTYVSPNLPEYRPQNNIHTSSQNNQLLSPQSTNIPIHQQNSINPQSLPNQSQAPSFANDNRPNIPVYQQNSINSQSLPNQSQTLPSVNDNRLNIPASQQNSINSQDLPNQSLTPPYINDNRPANQQNLINSQSLPNQSHSPASINDNRPIYTQSHLPEIIRPENSQLSSQTPPSSGFQPSPPYFVPLVQNQFHGSEASSNRYSSKPFISQQSSLSPSQLFQHHLSPDSSTQNQGYQYFHKQLPKTENQRQKTESPKLVSSIPKQFPNDINTQSSQKVPSAAFQSSGSFFGPSSNISPAAIISTNNANNLKPSISEKPLHKPMIFEETKTILQMPSKSFELPSYYTVIPNENAQKHLLTNTDHVLKGSQVLQRPIQLGHTLATNQLSPHTYTTNIPISSTKPMIFVETPTVPPESLRHPHMLYGPPLFTADNLYLPPSGVMQPPYLKK